MDPHIKKHEEQWTTALRNGRGRSQIKTLQGKTIAQLHEVPSSFLIREVWGIDWGVSGLVHAVAKACLWQWFPTQDISLLLERSQGKCFLPLLAERAGSVHARCFQCWTVSNQINRLIRNRNSTVAHPSSGPRGGPPQHNERRQRGELPLRNYVTMLSALQKHPLLSAQSSLCGCTYSLLLHNSGWN